jgi:hypothetical protein
MRSLITGTALLVCLAASGGEAQSLGDRLRQGADAVKEGAAGIAGRAEDTIGSTVDLFTDEATPEETRSALDAPAFWAGDRTIAEFRARARLDSPPSLTGGVTELSCLDPWLLGNGALVAKLIARRRRPQGRGRH